MTDDQIIELFWNRSEDAVSATDASYGRKLRGLSHRILQNLEDAEEMVNDTYLKTWNSIPKAQPQYFFAYIAAICRKLSLNRLNWNQAEKRKAEIVTISEELQACAPDLTQEQMSAGTDGVQRIDLPFTLTEAPATEEGILYHAEVPDAIPGLTVGELHITKSALGYNLRMPETVTDQDAYYNIMKIDVDGLAYGDGAASVLEDDGNWYFEAQMCQGNLSDPLTIRYYDWEKEPIGDIVFRRVSQ